MPKNSKKFSSIERKMTSRNLLECILSLSKGRGCKGFLLALLAGKSFLLSCTRACDNNKMHSHFHCQQDISVIFSQSRAGCLTFTSSSIFLKEGIHDLIDG